MKIYLNKLLSINVPLKLTYRGFKASYPATDFATKQEIPGKFQYLHVFSTDQYPDIALYANEYQHNDLQTFKEGDRLTVCKQEKKREGKPSFFNLIFAAEGDVMESVVNSAPMNTPTQARKMDQAVDHQKAKEMQICLQGFMQAHIIAGKSNSEALAHATLAREMLLESVRDALSPVDSF